MSKLYSASNTYIIIYFNKLEKYVKDFKSFGIYNSFKDISEAYSEYFTDEVLYANKFRADGVQELVDYYRTVRKFNITLYKYTINEEMTEFES